MSGASMARDATLWARLLDARAPRAVFLVRLAVGIVFLSEGVQKFLFPGPLGAGRFARIGIPAPGRHGIWGLLHEARTDLAMLLGALLLALGGGRPWSLDAALGRRGDGPQPPA